MIKPCLRHWYCAGRGLGGTTIGLLALCLFSGVAILLGITIFRLTPG